MNRLVIIGNGFDLAHGLPTSYRDFIDDFWSDVANNFDGTNKSKYSNDLIDVNYEFMDHLLNEVKILIKEVKDFSSFDTFITNYSKGFNQNFYDDKNGCKLWFNNNFLKSICNNLSAHKWVDIENVYYSMLKLNAKLNVKSNDSNKVNRLNRVKKLNKEFEQIKKLLEKYLLEKVNLKFEFDFNKNGNQEWKKIYDILKPISLLSNEHDVLKEFNNSEDVEEIKAHFEKEKKEELVNKLYFLNFNYTSTVKAYSDVLNTSETIESKVNYIHGEIGNISDNKVNFGFGDEMDEDYKEIENIDDNEYLKNFKSFQYLQNSNYNDLLSYIESEKFQVLIMGHSCGLSDRTLLNTIFEHKNCRSIKVFYHKKIDESDNYTDIIQNISRHFNDKKLMRERIVNKIFCKPLPQIQLPKKKEAESSSA